ncbi:MAG: prepilin-type N-terminal cleavage/methylation domain-containing protein [Kiritimatiellia bacterium]|jgi:prepilin-type processing-associated H-X9-DG protein
MRGRRNGAGQGSTAAFTIIELMIVIGIMIVLGGLLVPAVDVLRERGKSTECANNLRQWGQGFSMYIDEHRGIFPGDGSEDGQGDTADIGIANAWFNVVPPYIGMESYIVLKGKGKVPCAGVGKNPFICPKSAINQKLVGSYAAGTQTDFYCSYAMNHWIFNSQRDTSAITKRMRMSQVQKPSVFVVLSEAPTGIEAKIHPSTMGGESKDKTGFRHRNSANALFADWHVEPILKKNVLQDGMNIKDNAGGLVWNPERDEGNRSIE